MIRTLCFAIATCVVAFSSTANAQNFGFNFSSDREDGSLLADEVTGIVPQGNWNNWIDIPADNPGFRIEEGAATIWDPDAFEISGVIKDSEGTEYPEMTVDWACNNSWNTDNGTFEPDLKLMNGYLDVDAANPQVTIDVGGLPSALAAGFDVIVYIGSDGNGRTGKMTVGTTTYSYSTFSNQGGSFPFPFTQTTDTGDGNPNANYAVFSGQTGTSFTITLDRGSDNSGIHGFQIIAAPVEGVAGDANGDGNFDFGDIEAFFVALTDPAAYAVQFPNVSISLLDMNSDGNTDFGDIDAFFTALTAG